MKKLAILIIVVAVIGFFGYQEVMGYIADKVMERVAETAFSSEQINSLLENPEIKKMVEEQANNDVLITQIEASLKTDGVSTITTKEEAVELLKDKFSVSEIKDLITSVTNSNTKEELKDIQATLQAKLTAEELEALKVIALVEVLKNRE